MTRLLVSVRSAAEARIALHAGVDLIDVKEPARGSLGAADAETVAEVVTAVRGRVPVSVALGELRDWAADDGRSLASAASAFLQEEAGGMEEAEGTQRTRATWRGGLPLSALGGELTWDECSRINFVKLGLAGMRGDSRWPDRWREVMSWVPADVARVAVAYADWERAGAPSPEHVVRVGAEFGCAAVLVDTFSKRSGGLLDWWPRRQIAQFVDEVQASGRLCVLAGSLDAEAIERLLPLEPDYFAVRGGVCRGGREFTVDARLTAELVAIVGRQSADREDTSRPRGGK